MTQEIKELLMELNEDREDALIICADDGFTQGIQLSQQWLWDSENYEEKYVKQSTSAFLLRIAKELEERANRVLVEEVDKFIEEHKKKIKELFPNVRFNYFRIKSLLWGLSLSGEYCEDSISDLIEGIRDDFNYIFESAQLEVSY